MPTPEGSPVFVKMDLTVLSTIKQSAEFVLNKEPNLNVHFNNAGVMHVDKSLSQATSQGHETNLGVNVLGTFLLTKLLTPTLV